MIKLVSPESLREARDAKAAAAHEKQARKAAAAAAAEQKRLERLEKGRTPPQEMFRPRAGEGEGGKALEYSAWDEQGVPTKDQNGEDLPKSRVKKLKKEWDVQQKYVAEALSFSLRTAPSTDARVQIAPRVPQGAGAEAVRQVPGCPLDSPTPCALSRAGPGRAGSLVHERP